MPYMYSEMQNKLSKTRESPLESMGQIISSRCPQRNASYITMSGVDVTNVVVFDIIRAMNRVALNQNRNVVFTRSTAFCFILTVAILYV